MKYIFFILIALCFLSFDVYGQQVEYVHNADFFLGRELSVSSKGLSLAQHGTLVEQLRAHGSRVGGGVKSLFLPKITFKQVRAVHGAKGADALSIVVSKNKVAVNYTTPASLDKALYYLSQAMVVRRGIHVVMGRDIVDWKVASGTVSVKNGAINLSVGRVDMDAVKAQIRKTKGKMVFLTLISGKGWNIQSGALQGVNNEVLTVAQLRELVAYGSWAGVVVVPRFELLKANEIFETTTGHLLWSVEGMRFVRALIEQWVQGANLKVISLGQPSPEMAADKRYLDFLQLTTQRLEVEVVGFPK